LTAMQADPTPAPRHSAESFAADIPARPLLSVQDLCCVRNDIAVFRDLAFTLYSRRILLIEGDNGSGKTTLLRVLCGLLEPETGEVCWRGTDIRNDYHSYLREICYVGHGNGIKPGLTPLENLVFARELLASNRRIDPVEILKRFGLAQFEALPARYLSAGQRRRLALSRLLLAHRALWILDEPLTALDKAGRDLLWDVFRDHLSADGAVIMTSHDAFSAEDLRLDRLALD